MSGRIRAAFAVAAAFAAGILLACGSAKVPARAPPAPKTAKSPEAADAGPPSDAGGSSAIEPESPFAAIDEVVSAAIEAGNLPGCVVVVGRRDEILFRRAYGSRALLPERLPMTLDTVFDVASLTKPVATTTSLMKLVDNGIVDLDKPVAHYVPEVAKLPRFTVRQLLLHTSGLPATTVLSAYGADRARLLEHIGRLSNVAKPGERFVYSDVGFVLLEEVVRRKAGEDLATFSTREVFAPLGMTETMFLPSPALRARAAPTEQREGRWMVGEVHDPRAYAMGGVAGHAGLFSTADDLARFAQALLDETKLVSAKTRATFLTRYATPKGGRALGWDVDSPNATHKSRLFSPSTFGHGGFTGTAMWIDPERDLFLVFLSNRVHPEGKGAVHSLVAEIGSGAVAASDVRPGIDVLARSGFAELRGAKVGLLTNAGARARDGKRTLDVLRGAPGLTLVRIFSPEHGLGAEREGKIGDATYEGVPVTSLYGEHMTPTPETLDGIDTLVVDLQDAGTRFYTYASTMKLAMKVAAERKLRVVVLDRPNPLGGVRVEGPLLEADAVRSFVNHHRLPVRHGMTLGELAKLFAADENLDVRLDVVRAANWRRKDEWDRTGLPWVSPSPNLRSVTSVRLYPALGLLESTNVSVGRGTDMPFEVVGAPFVDPDALLAKIRELDPTLPGVAFEKTTFTPTSSVHAGRPCKGVRVRITDRSALEPVRTGVVLALALQAVAGTSWKSEKLDRMFGDHATVDAIRALRSRDEIERAWQSDLAAFGEKRRAFLLYE